MPAGQQTDQTPPPRMFRCLGSKIHHSRQSPPSAEAFSSWAWDMCCSRAGDADLRAFPGPPRADAVRCYDGGVVSQLQLGQELM